MKKFMQFIAAVKAIAALAFTAQIMLAVVASMLLRRDAVPIGIIMQMMFLALIFGCAHLFVFAEGNFKQLKTPGRLAVLGAIMFAALAGFAAAFSWFPAQNPLNWLVFAGIYAAAFLIAVIALRTVFRLSGVKYNRMLAIYNAENDKKY